MLERRHGVEKEEGCVRLAKILKSQPLILFVQDMRHQAFESILYYEYREFDFVVLRVSAWSAACLSSVFTGNVLQCVAVSLLVMWMNPSALYTCVQASGAQDTRVCNTRMQHAYAKQMVFKTNVYANKVCAQYTHACKHAHSSQNSIWDMVKCLDPGLKKLRKHANLTEKSRCSSKEP